MTKKIQQQNYKKCRIKTTRTNDKAKPPPTIKLVQRRGRRKKGREWRERWEKGEKRGQKRGVKGAGKCLCVHIYVRQCFAFTYLRCAHFAGLANVPFVVVIVVVVVVAC